MTDLLDPHADDLDLAHRELCPDGACVGVLGPDARCRVCGTVGVIAVRDPREQAFVAPPVAAARPTASDDDDVDTGDDEFDRRELCSDGACVGVLGSDRRCPVCGAAADA